MGMYGEEKKDQKGYEKLQSIMENLGNTESDDKGDEVKINEGLLALHEENPDCIAWIKIEDTAIDYPVMYHPQENNYYLRRDFHGEFSYSGSLFLSEICEPGVSDNLIIYGHHMNSGTMFAALDHYKSEDFYKEHPIIQYSTLQGDEEYQIIAAFATPVYTGNDFEYYGFSKAKTSEEYNDYVNGCLERSYYKTGYCASFGEKLLTLSTCEYSYKNGRMVVVAKQISGKEVR